MNVFGSKVKGGSYYLRNNTQAASWEPKYPKKLQIGRKTEVHLTQRLFAIDKQLGQGHFGKVYRATLCSEDARLSRHGGARSYFALKQFSKSYLLRASQKGSLLVGLIKREISIHRRLDHPYILKFHGHVFSDTHFSLVLEYAPHGDLFGFMARVPSSVDRLHVARHVTRQIAKAVSYLETQCVAHRDIKPENILVTDTAAGVVGGLPNVKLCDFGWAVRYQHGCCQTTLCGTPEYVPIEMLTVKDGERRYDAKYVDRWALGVLLFELLHGYTPFAVRDDDSKEATRRVYEEVRSFQGAKFLQMDCVTVDCFNLIDSLLQIEPTKRCSPADVAINPFLKMPMNHFIAPDSP